MATVKDIRDRLELSTQYPSGLQYKVDAGKCRRGMQAGYYCKGYYRIQIKGKAYQSHHIVALLADIEGLDKVRESVRLGNIDYVLDHIDGNSENNQPDNLRVIGHRANLLAHHNSLGRDLPLGVTKSGKGYRSQIHHNGKKIYVGYYSTPELAHAAYIAKAKELHPDDDNYIINC